MRTLPLAPLLWLPAAVTLLCGVGCAVDGASAPSSPLPPVGPKADVYGEDDRHDPSHPDVPPWLRRYSASVGGFVPLDDRASRLSDGSLELSGLTMAERYGLCPEEPFADQPVTGTCTGFLVGEDLLLTAGHCTERGECWPYPFVFGLNEARAHTGRVAATDVYYCREVIDFEVYGDEDWALLRLDRPATGRAPLPLRRASRAEPREFVVAIGHPSSLPLKVALHGQVAEIDHDSFVSDLDLFGGNSGSPIISLTSREVIGIYSSGSADFRYDRRRGCSTVARCGELFEGPGLLCAGGVTSHVDFVFEALDGVGEPTAPPEPTGPACDYRCDSPEFGYAVGECREGWECTGECIEPTGCVEACEYPCAAYGYTPTTCIEGWSCVDGCVVQSGCRE